MKPLWHRPDGGADAGGHVERAADSGRHIAGQSEPSPAVRWAGQRFQPLADHPRPAGVGTQGAEPLEVLSPDPPPDGPDPGTQLRPRSPLIGAGSAPYTVDRHAAIEDVKQIAAQIPVFRVTTDQSAHEGAG